MSSLSWEREGANWPNRQHSRFVSAGGLRWHVQMAGNGPTLLMLHGTGAATHSWRALLPLLQGDFSIVAPDLPGHGFTSGRPRKGMGLDGIGEAVGALIEEVGVTPAFIVGHSAGAAIACRNAIATNCATPLVGFAPALQPFPGIAARLFPALAKMLFVNPFVPSLFARMVSSTRETERFLVRSTGSNIEPEGIASYRKLLSNASHDAGALAMMASWDLDRLWQQLEDVTAPALLVGADRDTAVPPDSVEKAAKRMPEGEFARIEGGHLAHEEHPERAALMIRDFATRHGIL